MNYDFACLRVSQIAQYIAFFTSHESRETSKTRTDIFAWSESHFPKNSQRRIAKRDYLSTLLTISVCYYQRRLLAGILTRIKRIIVKFLFLLKVFFVFVFGETRFFRDLGSFTKLRNSSLIFAKHENLFVASFAKFSRNEILSKTLPVYFTRANIKLN